MTTLLQLDILEKEIYFQIDLRTKTKNKDLGIEDDFLFSCYRKHKDIHKSYIDLIKNGDKQTQNEALKRTLFIQWLGSFEPSYLTGMTLSFEAYEIADDKSGLELKDFQFVYGYLDNLIANKAMDDELFEMLSYYSSWEFVFEYENFKDFKNLNNFVRNVADTNKSWSTLIKKRDLNNRGHMGLYFLSLNNVTENTGH
jgi:hypothetical protein